MKGRLLMSTLLREIRDFPNYAVDRYGNVFFLKNRKNEKFDIVKIDPHCGKGGLYVYLRDSSGKRVQKFIHRLVAEAFLSKGFAGGLDDVIHLDGDDKNNNASNLKWVSHSEAISIKKKKSGVAVRDETTGKVYYSYSEAARSIGGSKKGVYFAATGIQASHKGHSFSVISA